LNQVDVNLINAKVEKSLPNIHDLLDEVRKVIVGQKELLDRLLVGLLGNGHILVEGVPGLAKTTAVKSLSEAVNAEFRRIQFTPDLLPADVVGTQIYSAATGEFSIKKGPVFSNFLLADEINRAPAKVQSALLEAMQERQVTIASKTFQLPSPFLVMATQNPVEQEGTYPLPEAQLDRFMLKVLIDYPDQQEEIKIVNRLTGMEEIRKISPVLTPEILLECKNIVNSIYVDEKIVKYSTDLVFATRYPDKYGLSEFKSLIEYGASPRASIYLIQAAKAYAYLQGRGYVVPQDIKSIGHDVMRPRVLISYAAEARNIDSDEILNRIFDGVEVP